MLADVSSLYEFFYTSQLDPQTSPTVVGQILSRARPHNAQAGVSGLLVFDGLRFFQHLEGPRAALEPLMGRIVGDARHEDVRILHEGRLDQRRYHRFDMGYAQTDDLDALAALMNLSGLPAVERFLHMRTGFDIQA
ncbi:BLUF domain-containing protein [uncultured Pseudacidovorax sp.]|uniref:BLUF domain-containing protein n=1 Tax=uncultured Pseudacidovorax sp. TaxID=679313 RepID=UPI0025DCF9E5|nr:BLUF domain-containing protein [uncultured Pseudacidovorax sp.]